MANEPISAQHIQLRASDSHTFDAYIASTVKFPEAAIVIVQEIYGLNHHVRSVTEGFAREGFLAIAPALFDRQQHNVELPYTPEGQQRGMALAKSIGMDAPLLDLAAAIEYAAAAVAPTAVGVVGYCWGGTLAWLAATRLHINAAVGYYGGRIAQYAAEIPQCPVLLHYGERDQHIPPSEIEAIRSRHPEAAIHTYDAGHGFNCDERESYNAEAASLAQARTVAFLKSKLLTH